MSTTQKIGHKRVAWIIDGAYMRAAAPGRVDWLKLRNLLEGPGERTFQEVYYFDGRSTESGQTKFFNALRLAPPVGPKFRVQLYELKTSCVSCPKCHRAFDRIVQRGVDVGIATLIFRLAVESKYDRLLLSTGDGDFEEAIAYAKTDLKTEIYIAAFRGSVSGHLQSYTDKMVWLDDYVDHFKAA